MLFTPVLFVVKLCMSFVCFLLPEKNFMIYLLRDFLNTVSNFRFIARGEKRQVKFFTIDEYQLKY